MNTTNKYSRQCSITGEGMNSGWCFFDGEKYAKYEEGALELVKTYGYNTIQEAYDNDVCYWTKWDDDDIMYEEINGKIFLIEN